MHFIESLENGSQQGVKSIGLLVNFETPAIGRQRQNKVLTFLKD
jgi:hypothetical protein